MRVIARLRLLLFFGVYFRDDFLLTNICNHGVRGNAGQRGQLPTTVPTVSAVLSMPKPGKLERC